MELLNWIAVHGFDVLGAIGIIAGLLFTGFSFRQDAKVTRIQNLLTITRNHREIWSELYRQPELSRVLDPKADIVAKPITTAERLFVRFVILHLKSAFEAGRNGVYGAPAALREDTNSFFSLPIPKVVWDKAKAFQDSKFATFVEGAMR
jgi:hypothetical protein